MRTGRAAGVVGVLLSLAVLLSAAAIQAETRSKYFRIRIPANLEFYRSYNPLYRIGALANYWNLSIYDVLMTRPDPAYIDGDCYQRMRSLALGPRIRLETDLEMAAPRFARLAWGVGQSFMWTHDLHENAFDAYADLTLSMEERSAMVERATDVYLRNPRALSPVPIPMEAMERLPYHGAFARRYPRMTGLIWAGH